jgi:hypothetical protein
LHGLSASDFGVLFFLEAGMRNATGFSSYFCLSIFVAASIYFLPALAHCESTKLSTSKAAASPRIAASETKIISDFNEKNPRVTDLIKSAERQAAEAGKDVKPKPLPEELQKDVSKLPISLQYLISLAAYMPERPAGK